MTYLLWALVLFLVPAHTQAATYYADPSGGGAASCVDNAANVCTLARAHTVASSGDTIVAADGTYDLGASALAITKNVTIGPVTAGGAVITTTNATSTVDLTASNDANTLTFGSFDVRNTGGAGQIMHILSAAYDATIELSGTRIPVGAVNRHIQDVWVRGTLKFTDVQLGGTIGAQAGIYSVTTPTSAKKIRVSGGNYTLTASTSNTPAIWIERAAGVSVSEWVHVAGATVNVTVPPGLGTSALGIGIRLHRITTGTNLAGLSEDPTIEGNTVTLTALGATGVDALGIVNSSTDATATANRTIIRNNTATCNGPATRCISIGTDGSSAFVAHNPQIYGNTVTNPYYDGSSTPHGISLGRVTGGLVWGNRINGFAVGIITAINQGGSITGNIISGAYYSPLFSKGSGATTAPVFGNNTIIMDDALYGAKIGSFGCLGVASQGATNNAATLFQNNLCVVRSGAAWKYTVVFDTSQVASFEHNNYFSAVVLTSPWNYQNTTYGSLATWNAASATIGTDTEGDPAFISETDLRLAAASGLRRTGLWWGNACRDYRGRPCFIPHNVGAYQTGSGDPAGTRAAR